MKPATRRNRKGAHAARPEESVAVRLVSVAAGLEGEDLVFDHAPVRLEALERAAHRLEYGFGVGRIAPRRRQLLDDLALPLDALARLCESLIRQSEVAVREGHGYLPPNDDSSESRKGTANASATTTTTTAVTMRSIL